MKTLEIAVMIPLNAAGAKGFRQFAETRPETWHFQILPLQGYSVDSLLSNCRLDGALVYSGDEQRDRFFSALPIPVVDLSSVREKSGLPRVIVNSRTMGQRAASYFLDKGHRHFGFVGFGNMFFSKARLKGFEETLSRHGMTVSVCEVGQEGHPEELPHPVRDEIISRFLRQLPRPCALYVATDTLALRISVLIRDLGLHIPEDVALLGTDNVEAACMLASPSLSSISFPSMEIGRRAAERLAGLMNGTGQPTGDWTVEPGPVVERASTDMMLIQDPVIRLCMNWIRRHASQAVGVQEMARDVRLSRRELERRVRRHLRATPLELLQRERVKLVKQSLLQFQLSLEEVAELSGFGDVKWMTTVFRRYTGQTPAAYRRREILKHSD